MTDTPKGPQGDGDAEVTTDKGTRAAPPEQDTAPDERPHFLSTVWARIPKTIPHTRARTSTVVLMLVFLGLMWWYLELYAQFVPKEQRRTGQPPAATSTAPATAEPTYETPVSTTPSRVPSSAAPSSDEAGESGPPSSTVPGRTGGQGPASTGGPTSGIVSSSGIVFPGVTLPGLPGATTEPPASGGAPTTTGPPG
ncbi:hypothetical protein [Tsukamurella paurometabola]|uniref:Transmembrane protein n=1 Tax=Tsukamurella paurometabola TaxID=2061 RepID=A0ABS5NBE3_TSUPA|nr:hypothetical protein [Tsukamurella paurometabola]MBS4101609.1 hypothetical protein [Tsukamurella paurometabola]